MNGFQCYNVMWGLRGLIFALCMCDSISDMAGVVRVVLAK